MAERIRFRSRFFVLVTVLSIIVSSQSFIQAKPAIAALPEVTIDAGQLQVMPGGQTVGVKLKTKGVLVVGHHVLEGENGEQLSPAERARLQLGDLIVAINGVEVKGAQHFSELVQQALKSQTSTSKSLKLIVERSGTQIETTIIPIFDRHAEKYRLGIYVRDSAAGVGTLTFYSRQWKRYGALGHMISDSDTHAGLPVREGEIYPSEVTSIRKGDRGKPGEKHAQVIPYAQPLGTIEKNTDFGIFGELLANPNSTPFDKPISIATRNEVKEGPAQILTVIEGQKIEPFAIEIVRLNRQSSAETRSMVIRVTDPRLLAKTGGIIQGMSGSPIIQNGKLVGAVTHVFVNDPTSGYGCYIEWMLQDAGIKLSVA